MKSREGGEVRREREKLLLPGGGGRSPFFGNEVPLGRREEGGTE